MESDSWRSKILLAGALGGLALGLGTAYLLIRTADEKGAPPQITTRDALRAGVGVIGVVRAIAALGEK